MYTLRINEKEYELMTNLLVIKRVEGKIKGSFISLVNGIETQGIPLEDILTILKCGLRKATQAEQEELEENILENCEYEELFKMFGEYLGAIFKGKTKDKEMLEGEEKK